MYAVYYSINGKKGALIGHFSDLLNASLIANKKGINGFNGVIKPMIITEPEKQKNISETHKKYAKHYKTINDKIHAMVKLHLDNDYVSGQSRIIFEQILKLTEKDV